MLRTGKFVNANCCGQHHPPSWREEMPWTQMCHTNLTVHTRESNTCLHKAEADKQMNVLQAYPLGIVDCHARRSSCSIRRHREVRSPATSVPPNME